MSEINILADKIEEATKRMFACFAEHDSGMYNYALLFNTKISKTWVVVLFFGDKVKLKSSLNSGFCYAAYKFLQDEYALIDNQLPVNIRFDAGHFPSDNLEYEQLLEKHIMTYDTLNNEKGQQQICSQCGHDWNKHQIMFHKIEGKPPLEGWIVCPEEDCFCFMTWDTPITEKNKN